MGNARWGLITCIILVMMAHVCAGGGNRTIAACSKQERLALLKFKRSVKDNNGLMLSSWGVDDDCCRWDRIGCDAAGRVVTVHLRGDFHDDPRYLNLSALSFSGNIPHQIGNLSNLKVLDLNSQSSDLLTRDMSWISGLSKLEHLDLSGADLSRAQNLDTLLYTIPSLSKLILNGCELFKARLGSYRLNSSRKHVSSIKHLDLGLNGFTGQLPGLFLNMTSVMFLDLSGNYYLSTEWIFEKLLNTMPTVTELHLSRCGLRKLNLSPNLNVSKHYNIQHLDVSVNEIEGRFPYIVTNMSSLLSLDLSQNLLNSTIPVNILKLDISWNKFRKIEDVGIWRQCHLEELIVSNNNLEGELIDPSTNVSECSQNSLEVLYLDHNALNGSIPESLGRLTNLRGLDLSYNQLSGSIPESLGRLKALTDIILKSNRLTGHVPVSLGRLASLRVLSVSSNLLYGTIPNSIGQLTKLYHLDISNNSLQGVVSDDHFANLSMLEYLNADYNNKLHFNISREWIPPFQLKVVRLSSCKIEDVFPQWLRTQRKLKVLVLTNTSIFGPLPTWLRLLPIIYDLDLSNNKLTGTLKNLPYLYEVGYAKNSNRRLRLQDNILRGLIPRSLCKRRDLEVLDLSRNRLTGKIPKGIWNLSSLGIMLLSSNRLSGVIPSSLLDIPTLEWLQLNDNNFSGQFPQDLLQLPRLVFLDLGENKISGNIPENITSLIVLRLHKNNFTGRIPHSVCKCVLLQVLDLAHNNLTGSIPRCFGELKVMKTVGSTYYAMMKQPDFSSGNIMQVLKGAALNYTKTLEFVKNKDLSSNNLDGEIPGSITTLSALVGLNLSNNHVIGGIPKDIGNMTSLFSLDLSANKLTGMIPSSMADLNFLSYLNLSHNNLSGQIPTGNQLQTLTDPSMYDNNTYLCGAPLPNECFPRHKPPTTTSENKNKYKNANDPNKVWFYLDIMSGFATGFWGIIGVSYFKKQWRRKLFMISEAAMDKIYVAVAVRVSKMRRGREAA